jgi:hypothetical protein
VRFKLLMIGRRPFEHRDAADVHMGAASLLHEEGRVSGAELNRRAAASRRRGGRCCPGLGTDCCHGRAA